jgi:hypothetical protein
MIDPRKMRVGDVQFIQSGGRESMGTSGVE